MTSEAKDIIEITDQAVKTLTAAMELVSNKLDEMIPWKEYEETMNKLDLYITSYSVESGKIVGDVSTFLLNAQDKYFSATQKIGSWCYIAVTFLKIYLELFTESNSEKIASQKKILMQVLDNGVLEMNKANDDIEVCSDNFNKVVGHLKDLKTRLSADFDSQREYYQNQIDKIRAQAYAGAAGGIVLGPFGLIISYSIAAGVVEGKLVSELTKKLCEVQDFFDDLKTKVDDTSVTVDTTKKELKNEQQNIRKLKDATVATSMFISNDEIKELHQRVEGSVNNLISLCEKYRERHNMNKGFQFSRIVFI